MEHYLECMPLRLVVGLHDDEYDPTASIRDTSALGPAAADNPASCDDEVRGALRRRALATVVCHTLRADRREHGMPGAHFSATTVNAVVRLHLREVTAF